MGICGCRPVNINGVLRYCVTRWGRGGGDALVCLPWVCSQQARRCSTMALKTLFWRPKTALDIKFTAAWMAIDLS